MREPQIQPGEPIVLKGTQLLLSAHATEGRFRLRRTKREKSDLVFHWCPAHAGTRLTYSVPISHPGRYRVSGQFQRSNMFGRIRLAIAGQVLGKSFDGYAPQTQPSGEIIFGEAQFAAGKTDLTLEIIGSNPHSGGYQVRIGQLKLTPVAGEPLSPS